MDNTKYIHTYQMLSLVGSNLGFNKEEKLSENKTVEEIFCNRQL